MEILAVVVAFWLVSAGLYGAVSWLRSQDSPAALRSLRPPRSAFISGSSRLARQARAALAAGPIAGPARLLSAPSGTIDPLEIDVLRARVEYLRGELIALQSVARVYEKPRRPAAGVPARLPRPLRRRVREAQLTRRVRRRHGRPF